MTSKYEKQRLMWRAVFVEVIEQYQHINSSLGTLGCMNYEQALGPSGSRNPNMVRPSLADFVCDVEIAARRALSPKELMFFQKYYINPALEKDIPNGELKVAVMEKVGKMLMSKRIYPLGQYFKAKEVRKAS